jgi:uncharacterized protein (TIGR03790 family)
MMHPAARILCVLLVVLAATAAWAGDSGLNVVVVVNQNSTNSVQLANDYCERRGVPPQNLFRMTGWTGGSVQWSRTDFETYLRDPMLAMLAGRALTNQVEIVLLSMDIPYRILDSGSYNATTSALFYGFKADTTSPGPGMPASCSLPDASSNSYAFCELPFRSAPPNTASTNSFLTMMLTDTSLAGAESILNSGLASDSSFPTQAVYLAKTSDAARNVRFVEFDDAIFDARLRGDSSLIWINTDSTSFTNLLGLLTGLANLSLPANGLLPGAIGDSLTSYAGDILENSGQTSLLAFLNAGASASYGTVVEPCNYTQKFPHPLDYFYQARGFCLAESYYQSLANPYQGLMVGEPLAAPFARPGTATWSSLTNGAVLSGQVALQPSFFAAAGNLPLGQADLFVDGTFFQTMTNLPPAGGNVLSVTLNGVPINYTVPANATVASTVTGLGAALNAQTNATRVVAYPTGDRLEFQSLDLTNPGANVTLTASVSAGTAGQTTSLLSPARPAFLDTTATGYLVVMVSNAPVAGDWLELDFIKTNGARVTVSLTNAATGPTIGGFAQSLLNQINANPALQPPDGVSASDLVSDSFTAQFALYARTPGWAGAQIQATLTASTNLLALPTGTNRLQDNLSDLRPRNHLYFSSGLGSLSVSFGLDTARLTDGFHDLLAVAYQGDSVRTQTRIVRTVRVQNTALTATLTPSLVGTNVTLDAPLRFTVMANTPGVSRIELFGTGGSLGVVSNQQSAVFVAPSAFLGVGLHPFYAVVTDTAGNQYRTQTDWLRLIPSFNLTISNGPLALSWPAVPGQQYDVMATTNLAKAFQVVGSVTATNSTVQWPLAVPVGAGNFYRVRLSP